MREPDRRAALVPEKWFTGDLRAAEFVDVSLDGAEFLRAHLGGVRMRAVDVTDLAIDSPQVAAGQGGLLVNGVDVVPLVEAELNRRWPGRSDRRAPDAAGLRRAWSGLEQAWELALARAAALPEGSVDLSVGGEWSFSQTLRHLVMITDTWLRGTVEEIKDPYHPIGQPSTEYLRDGDDLTPFDPDVPSYEEVLEVRAGRVAMVREFVAALTDELLEETRPDLWVPEYEETVRSCLHTILCEEWEHLRYALRDLHALARTDR
jgi:hypothetical protein